MRVTNIVFVGTLAALVSRADTSQGIAAFNAGRYSVARQQLLAADKNDETARLFLALTEAAVGDCAAALPVLIREPLNRMGAIAAVKCYSSAADTSREFSLLQQLQQQFPNDADVLYLSARQHMKAFNDATFSMFQHAPSSYRVHQLSADVFEVQNRFDEAIAEYRKAIELNPDAPDLHFQLGRALLLQGHAADALEQAAAQFQAELKLSPEDASCEFQLGQIAQVQSKAADAKAHFKKALQLSPTFVQALLALGKMEKNPELLKKATELEPNNEAAHYALLTVYRDSGQMDNAKAEKAILDKLQKPEDGEFADFLKRLGEKPTQP